MFSVVLVRDLGPSPRHLPENAALRLRHSLFGQTLAFRCKLPIVLRRFHERNNLALYRAVPHACKSCVGNPTHRVTIKSL